MVGKSEIWFWRVTRQIASYGTTQSGRRAHLPPNGGDPPVYIKGKREIVSALLILISFPVVFIVILLARIFPQSPHYKGTE